MNKIAVDTNIMLYMLDDKFPEKQSIAVDIIADSPYFCSQNLSEFVNFCLRKLKFPKARIAKLIKRYLEECNYIPVTEQILLKSLTIMNIYDFQLFDSIIVTSALDAGCSILYSEDMSDGQIINKQLKISNPFKLKAI